VIHPPHGLASDDRNALSLVILLRYGYFSVLLTGDIGASEERTILSHLPKVTVLKIAHHGSRFSTSQELLSTTAPQVAMISAGRRNPFGHPSPDVLERIRKNGALAASTSTLGSLRILTDGFKFELQHYSMRRKEFVTLSRGIAHRNSGTHPQGQGSSHEPPIRDHREALTLEQSFIFRR
jgi:competence protein ComEC